MPTTTPIEIHLFLVSISPKRCTLVLCLLSGVQVFSKQQIALGWLRMPSLSAYAEDPTPTPHVLV
jgi:hypothetical protein